MQNVYLQFYIVRDSDNGHYTEVQYFFSEPIGSRVAIVLRPTEQRVRGALCTDRFLSANVPHLFETRSNGNMTACSGLPETTVWHQTSPVQGRTVQDCSSIPVRWIPSGYCSKPECYPPNVAYNGTLSHTIRYEAKPLPARAVHECSTLSSTWNPTEDCSTSEWYRQNIAHTQALTTGTLHQMTPLQSNTPPECSVISTAWAATEQHSTSLWCDRDFVHTVAPSEATSQQPTLLWAANEYPQNLTLWKPIDLLSTAEHCQQLVAQPSTSLIVPKKEIQLLAYPSSTIGISSPIEDWQQTAQCGATQADTVCSQANRELRTTIPQCFNIPPS